MRSSWLISRRTSLKGLGVALALPLFETMGWADPAKGTAAKPPVRLGFIYHPMGVWQPEFWPTDAATFPTVLPKTLETIRPIIGECLILDHLKGPGGIDGEGDHPPHANELSAWLTAAQFNLNNRTNIDIAVSTDQIAAQQIGVYTVVPSLELGYYDNAATGLGENGVNNRYYSSHSFRTPTEALPLETSPANVMKRLFSSRKSTPRKRGGPAVDAGKFNAGAGDKADTAEESLDRSMLDLVRENAKELRGRVSIADQRSLDQYLDTLRSLETRVAAIEQQQAESQREQADKNPAKGALKSSPPITITIPTQTPKWSEHTRLMGDLMILAFQTDSTRVCSLVPSYHHHSHYQELGFSETHHDLSHTEKNPDKISKLAQVDRFNLEQFSYLVTRMKSLKEGAGTLLDNCIFMWGSGMQGATATEVFGHQKNRLPTIIAGRGGGTIRTGRYVPQCAGNAGDLLTGILARAGVKLDKPIGCGTKLSPDLS